MFRLGFDLKITPKTSSTSGDLDQAGYKDKTVLPDTLTHLSALNFDLDTHTRDKRQLLPVPPTARGDFTFGNNQKCLTPCYTQKSVIQPDKVQVDQNLSGDKFGLCIAKTEHRVTQEDRFVANENFNGCSQNGVFAVIDGHGGQHCPEFIKDHLEETLLEQRNLSKHVVSGIKQVFSRLDQKFLDQAESRNYSSGAACLLALIQFGKLTIANLGDCVGLLVSKAGRMTKLSVEQTLSRQDENKRIVSQNGRILQNKLNGCLEVSRAFGNIEWKKFIISEPEAHTYQIKASDDLLILSTDGLFKKFTKSFIAERVYDLRKEGKTLQEISKQVVDECTQGNQCRDNVTLIIVSLREYYQDFRQNHHRRYPAPYSDCSSCSLGTRNYCDPFILQSQSSFSSENSVGILKQLHSDKSSLDSRQDSPRSLQLEPTVVKRVKIGPSQDLQNQNPQLPQNRQVLQPGLKLQTQRTFSRQDKCDFKYPQL